MGLTKLLIWLVAAIVLMGLTIAAGLQWWLPCLGVPLVAVLFFGAMRSQGVQLGEAATQIAKYLAIGSGIGVVLGAVYFAAVRLGLGASPIGFLMLMAAVIWFVGKAWSALQRHRSGT